MTEVAESRKAFLQALASDLSPAESSYLCVLLLARTLWLRACSPWRCCWSCSWSWRWRGCCSCSPAPPCCSSTQLLPFLTLHSPSVLGSTDMMGGGSASWTTGIAYQWVKTDTRARTLSSEPAGHTRAINKFCNDNGIQMCNNPCVSPDFCVDWASLKAKIDGGMEGVRIWEKSGFATAAGDWLLCEDEVTGDYAWLLKERTGDPKVMGAGKQAIVMGSYEAFPATWENLLRLKNLIQEHDPESTIFPSARGTLEKRSLGIGARLTAMHWPAVDWAMSTLGLSVTANQNSIPRELVYDVDEMLAGRLGKIMFMFIGAEIPEGHQGTSVEGMSHGSVLAKLKYGFHQQRIPWGFNADHQPVGGKWDLREDALVRGSILASYITYDVSHQLLVEKAPETAAEAVEYILAKIPGPLAARTKDRVQAALAASDNTFNLDEFNIELCYLWPALCKMKIRDDKYRAAREAAFTTQIGRNIYRELSVDEMPGLTSPLRLSCCLALTEALGMPCQYVAPAFGFQKNFPFPDNVLLKERIGESAKICKVFDVSIGFHSGSGKSAENYNICGEVCKSNLEVKTSGRYTYELGVALSKSPEKADQDLWIEWYTWCLTMATQSAFSEEEQESTMARAFITETLNTAADGVNDETFSTPVALRAQLDALEPSPDHMVWFEYNFLFQLCAGGEPKRENLGDQTIAGFTQRARFYSITDAGKLLFAKGIASYVIFLAETTLQKPKAVCAAAYAKLDSYTVLDDMLADIAPGDAVKMNGAEQ